MRAAQQRAGPPPSPRRAPALRRRRAVRVAILSDTHGHLDARVAALVREADCAVHAGDVGAAAVLAALQPRSGTVLAVRGNNDTPSRWPRGEAGRLEALPPEAELELPGGRLVIVHGDRAGRPARRHAWLRAAYPGARAVVYGHSHRLCCDRSALPWVINPGAAGRARTFGGPSCVLLIATREGWTLCPHRYAPAARPRSRRR